MLCIVQINMLFFYIYIIMACAQTIALAPALTGELTQNGTPAETDTSFENSIQQMHELHSLYKGTQCNIGML